MLKQVQHDSVGLIACGHEKRATQSLNTNLKRIRHRNAGWAEALLWQ
ncbi:hypothetical protein [Mucilaginibacter limnophilus]|nr:hypothetical protein [Mucilaginibacter limnophilus]